MPLNDIDLTEWSTLIASAQMCYTLVMIEMEQKEPGCAFIGKVAKQTARYVSLKKVNPQGEWDEKEKFPFKNITQVEFGDGYTGALAHLVAHEEAACE